MGAGVTSCVQPTPTELQQKNLFNQTIAGFFILVKQYQFFLLSQTSFLGLINYIFTSG